MEGEGSYFPDPDDLVVVVVLMVLMVLRKEIRNGEKQ